MTHLVEYTYSGIVNSVFPDRPTGSPIFFADPTSDTLLDGWMRILRGRLGHIGRLRGGKGEASIYWQLTRFRVLSACMPRRARIAPGGMVFHCINRGNDRRAIFDDWGDYAAFERVMEKTLEAVPIRILAYCLMPNHFHLLLWPRSDGQLASFMQRLQVTHGPGINVSRAWQAEKAGQAMNKWTPPLFLPRLAANL